MDTLFERLQSALLHNDKSLEVIDTRREELKRICQEEEDKIATLCSEVQERVSAAGEVLKAKSFKEFNKLDEELASTREAISKDSHVLCKELDKLTEVVKKGEEDKFDMAACWDKVKCIISAKKEINSKKGQPHFPPGKNSGQSKVL